MPFTDRKLEVKASKTMAQTASQAAVYAKGLSEYGETTSNFNGNFDTDNQIYVP
jgi:hypothetical protein